MITEKKLHLFYVSESVLHSGLGAKEADFLDYYPLTKIKEMWAK